MKVEDILIIGAGPAGLAAGIQLQRYGLNPLILERAHPGGLLRNANWVENYPGFPQGISGANLVNRMLQQAAETEVEIISGEVTRLDWNGRHFRVETNQQVFRACCVVIASGTQPRTFTDFTLPIQGAQQILYEIAPILELQGADVAIVGAGDAAFDYALNLAQRENQVWILNRGDTLKCLPLLWERTQAQSLIHYCHHTEILNAQHLPAGQLELACQSPAGLSHFQVDYLIGALGREPHMDFISENLQRQTEELEAKGWLYRIGDLRNGIYRQTAIAVGDGLRAAMQIYQKLKEPDL